MVDKALISELTWRSLYMQRKAFPDMPHFVAPDEISTMLRSSTRKETLNIHVLSEAIIADTEQDYRQFWASMKKRKATLHVKERNAILVPWCLDMNGVVKIWKTERKNGAAKIGGRMSADKKEAASREACEQIKDRWPLSSLAWSTNILLDEVGIVYNTAIKYLGKRPIAQYNYAAKQKRIDRRNAKAEANS
jgi:hypothetical protein